MSYEILRVETLDDEFIGFVVWKRGTSKLEDSNVWLPDEGVEDHVVDLNDKVLLREHWPDARDPDVQALVNDPNYEPLVFETTEMVDEATNEVATITALRDPAQPQERFHRACELVARKRARSR